MLVKNSTNATQLQPCFATTVLKALDCWFCNLKREAFIEGVMEQELLYEAIKAFLKVTRNMVQGLEHDQATFLLERTKLLEATLQGTYQRKDREKLRSVGQRADDLAVEVLALLDKRSDLPLLEPEGVLEHKFLPA
jgi:hypothetical protein